MCYNTLLGGVKMNNGTEIAISNPLLGANLQLDLLGRKILCIALAHIDTKLGKQANNNNTDEEIKVVISTGEVNKLLQYHKNEKSLNEVCKKLAKNDSVIVKEDKQQGYLHIAHIFTDIWVENGIFTAKFNKSLNQHINNLLRNFTIIELEHILLLKSSYAIILFCMVWQHRNEKRPFKIGVGELRHVLGVEDKKSYNAMCNFILRCIELPIKEINRKLQSVLNISYSRIKKGREVEYFTFKTVFLESESAPPDTQSNVTDSKYYASQAKDLAVLTISDNGKPTLSEKNALAILREYQPSLLDIRMVIVAAKEQKSKGHEIGGGWIRQAIKDRFRPNDISLEKTARKEMKVLYNCPA